jgi:hypothetical protein
MFVTFGCGVGAARRFKKHNTDSHIAWVIGFLAIFVSNLAGVLISLPYHAGKLADFDSTMGLPLGLLIVAMRFVWLPVIGWVGARLGLFVWRRLGG